MKVSFTTLIIDIVMAMAFTIAIPGLVHSQESKSEYAKSIKPTSAPDVARLRIRVDDYYKAMESRNVKAMYNMSPPYFRDAMTLDEYKKGGGYDKEWLSKKIKIHEKIEKICIPCLTAVFAFPNRPKTTRCVLLMKIIDSNPKSGVQNKVKYLEMWEYYNSEWYHGLAGEGDSCPGK